MADESPSVLHLVHVFPPESHGGTELYVRSVASAQSAAGWRVAVASGSERYDGTEILREEHDGLAVFRLPMNWKTRDPDWSCGATKARILSLARAGSYDLVHLHHWHNLTSDIVRALDDEGFAVVVTLSDFFSSCPRFFRLPDLRNFCPPDLEREVCVQCLSKTFVSPEETVRAALDRRQEVVRTELERARTVIAISRSQAAILQAMPLFAGIPLRVVPYPSPSLPEPERAAGSGHRDGWLRVVCWGGLDPGKGFDLLVEACQNLREPERVELHHYGTVLDEAYVQKLASAATRCRPVFHGRFGRAELLSRFPEHDVAVFPSFYHETHGLAVDEALQLGLPVIVSDRGAPKDRIGERGLVFPAGDAGALTALLQAMVDDPAVLRRLKDAQPVTPYTLERHHSDLATIYRESGRGSGAAVGGARSVATLPTRVPDVSVVILSWNTIDLLRECLKALRVARDGLNLELIVIDNGSVDGSADMVVAEFPEAALERNATNRGYAPAVNQGLARARGRDVCLLGSDTRMRAGTLRTLVDFLGAHPAAGAVAPPLLNEDGSRQLACKRFPTLGTALFWDTPFARWWPEASPLRRYEMREWNHYGTREVDQPPGTCFLIRKRIVDEIGPMDERLWLFFNDVDWALRIRRAGHQIWYVESPGVHHRESSSVRKFESMAIEWHRNRIRYYRKHHRFLGSSITKLVAVYVALREGVRTKRGLPFAGAWWRNFKNVLVTVFRLIREA